MQIIPYKKLNLNAKEFSEAGYISISNIVRFTKPEKTIINDIDVYQIEFELDTGNIIYSRLPTSEEAYSCVRAIVKGVPGIFQYKELTEGVN